MSTVNISLTTDQVRLVDRLTETMDFANRSEFFRALLRLLAHRPQLLSEAEELILEAPGTRSLATVKKELKKTGQYSPQFITSVVRGLEESGYYSK